MKRLTATYSIVRPMFLGDANQNATTSCTPAIKGALRFWWRALTWSQIRDQNRTDVPAALKELHTRDGSLWGKAAGQKGAGQSRVLLSADVEHDGKIPAHEAFRGPATADEIDGIKYLGGQGLNDRKAIKAGSIRLHVVFRPGTSTKKRKSVERTLMVLGLLGGIGSRSRRGFGSLSLQAIEGDRLLEELQVPHDAASFRNVLTCLVTDANEDTPPFSAFSSNSRIDVSTFGGSPEEAHNTVGTAMRKARADLTEDNIDARQVAIGEDPGKPPDRSVFGLPLQFFFRDPETNRGTTVHVEPNTTKEQKMGRRGSPCLVHIHAFPNEDDSRRFGAVQTFLPAQFLPNGIGMRVRSATSFRYPNFTPPFSPIIQYLDSFSSRQTVLP